MKLNLVEKECEFLIFLIEERRLQIKAIRPLWERHHRQDAKRIMDGFPYEKGELIPYLRKGEKGQGVIFWEPQTHNDLIADIRDHLAECQNNPDDEKTPVIHGLLKKMEALAEEANKEMKKQAE